jgi:peroxiredoxin
MFISFTLDNAPTIERVKEKYRLKFPAFTVSQEEASRLNQHSGFPTSIVLDKSGKIRYMCGSGGTKANNAEKVREFVMTKLYAEITNAF